MNPSTMQAPHSMLSAENRPMLIAIVVSILLHCMLMLIRFGFPESIHFSPADTGLEVILVNAKHDKKPVKADAIAQANLDGGGNADQGFAQSPLPDLRKIEDGEDITVASSRIESLEKQQEQILSKVKSGAMAAAPMMNDGASDSRNNPTPGKDLTDSSKALARTVAAIDQRISDENKRPRKTFISPTTRQEGYAMYYKAMQKKVEEYGTLNFPQYDGKKLYGQVTLSIPVFQDGSIYEKEGGIKVERSSGNRELDAAAIRIVKRRAPFGLFPANMRSRDRDDIWVVVTRFTFTREETLQTELREKVQ